MKVKINPQENDPNLNIIRCNNTNLMLLINNLGDTIHFEIRQEFCSSSFNRYMTLAELTKEEVFRRIKDISQACRIVDRLLAEKQVTITPKERGYMITCKDIDNDGEHYTTDIFCKEDNDCLDDYMIARMESVLREIIQRFREEQKLLVKEVKEVTELKVSSDNEIREFKQQIVVLKNELNFLKCTELVGLKEEVKLLKDELEKSCKEVMEVRNQNQILRSDIDKLKEEHSIRLKDDLSDYFKPGMIAANDLSFLLSITNNDLEIRNLKSQIESIIKERGKICYYEADNFFFSDFSEYLSKDLKTEPINSHLLLKQLLIQDKELCFISDFKGTDSKKLKFDIQDDTKFKDEFPALDVQKNKSHNNIEMIDRLFDNEWGDNDIFCNGDASFCFKNYYNPYTHCSISQEGDRYKTQTKEFFINDWDVSST
jgi:hypothetical protein